MKIIQVIPVFRLAGAEIMCENLCVALKNAGETVIAVSLYSEQTAITERLVKNGVRIVFLEKKPGFDPAIFVKLERSKAVLEEKSIRLCISTAVLRRLH